MYYQVIITIELYTDISIVVGGERFSFLTTLVDNNFRLDALVLLWWKMSNKLLSTKVDKKENLSSFHVHMSN